MHSGIGEDLAAASRILGLFAPDGCSLGLSLSVSKRIVSSDLPLGSELVHPLHHPPPAAPRQACLDSLHLGQLALAPGNIGNGIGNGNGIGTSGQESRQVLVALEEKHIERGKSGTVERALG